MGGNGSHAHALSILNTENNRAYRTVFSLGENIKVLEQKDPKRSGKLPEESRTPNRIYVSFIADGHDVKEIAKYGPNGIKEWSIHTLPHNGIQPHYHIWKNGAQQTGAFPLTEEMKELLEKIRNYGQDK